MKPIDQESKSIEDVLERFDRGCERFSKIINRLESQLNGGFSVRNKE